MNTASHRRPRIVCATSLARGEAVFSRLGDVTMIPEGEIDAAAIRNADVLATRSKVCVNDSLLEGSSLKFYGTATAGFDHVDAQALEKRGIPWAQAPGSNANSVAEYVLAALASLGVKHGIDWTGKTIGIIGAGHVGSRLASLAEAFGLNVLLNDPPLFEQTNDPNYLPLEDVLRGSDIISLHVPFTRDGRYATMNMVNGTFLELIKSDAVFINASRGEVTDESALKRAIGRAAFSFTILDVFQNEPDIDPTLLNLADIATPHIAGYSYDGRVKGTEMIYRAACRCLGQEPEEVSMQEESVPSIPAPSGNPGPRELYEIILAAYDPAEDDARLRARPDETGMGSHFKALRNSYPRRLEFNHYKVSGVIEEPDLALRLKRLGFVVQSAG